MNHMNQQLETNGSHINLTATELSNVWASYLKNSMERRFFEYFLAKVEDVRIKQVIEKMLAKNISNMEELTVFFQEENIHIPRGFTEEDVAVGASKVFSDTFMLYFCYDITMLSMSTYPSALSDSSRNDIRAHFQGCLEYSTHIQNELTDLMLSLGVYLKSPQVTVDSQLDFVGHYVYLNGSIGEPRPLNTAEIANLTRILHRANFSKMIYVSFSQLAKTKKLKKHFSRGRDALQNVIDMLDPILKEEDIPLSASGDYKMYDVEMPPFSEKLMLFFVNTCLGMFCFTMISQAMASSLRSDILLALNQITKDMKKFYGSSLLLTIQEQWLERPPQSVNKK
ncbi:DUF3231 family protein [Bacillus coahuilensis]|uniref:DUF3231 family protein n=1 Tax=Bacillus coahuilensis TaxID=408580 RepID=UPI0002E74945|nr:DUF3231 family protein [Bacillus coahuilensis]